MLAMPGQAKLLAALVELWRVLCAGGRGAWAGPASPAASFSVEDLFVYGSTRAWAPPPPPWSHGQQCAQPLRLHSMAFVVERRRDRGLGDHESQGQAYALAPPRRPRRGGDVMCLSTMAQEDCGRLSCNLCLHVHELFCALVRPCVCAS